MKSLAPEMTSLTASGPLSALLQRNAAWKKTCQDLVAPTMKWISAEPRPAAKVLSQEVASLVCKALPELPGSAALWCLQLFLDSPALNRRLRVSLLDSLTMTGVYRDFSDLPPITSFAVLGLLCAVRATDVGECSALNTPAREGLKAWPNLRPTASDAFLLSELLHPPELELCIGRNGHAPLLTDLFETARWLHSLKSGIPVRMPANEVTQAWLAIGAFRGIRRAWVRKMGASAGGMMEDSVPEGLRPSMTRLGAPYGSMVVEWTLSAIRNWPDRQSLADNDPEVLEARSTKLVHEACECLKSVENKSKLVLWLQTAAAQLIRPDEGQRDRTFQLSHSPFMS